MNRRFLVVTLMIVIAMSVTACTSTYQTLKQQPADTTSAHHPKWSYAGNTGPEFWGEVKGANVCKTGKKQSPIDITKVTASSVSAPIITYSQSTTVRIQDNGHTVVYTPITEDNTITLHHERYVLKQFHYHTPSEHQFGGQNYSGELHFVHANSENELAVIAVMLQIGQNNENLRVLLDGTQLTAENDTEFTANKVDLSALISTAPTFYRYSGSLTTPPCTEQVQWYVSKQPLSLASAQFSVLLDLYSGNNRPIQPQSHRVVKQLSH